MNKEICKEYCCKYMYRARCKYKTKRGPGTECTGLKDKSKCKYKEQFSLGDCEYCKNVVCEKGVAILNKRQEKVIIAIAYTDGSFNKATQTYGYGVVFKTNDGYAECFKGSGNNPETAKMYQIGGEILGACKAIQVAKSLNVKEITIFYDYLGIENWVTGTWRANNEKTIAYREYVRNSGITVKFKKIKAHSGVELNEKADLLAKQAVGLAKD